MAYVFAAQCTLFDTRGASHGCDDSLYGADHLTFCLAAIKPDILQFMALAAIEIISHISLVELLALFDASIMMIASPICRGVRSARLDFSLTRRISIGIFK